MLRVLILALVLAAASPRAHAPARASAERVRVYSIQGLDGGDTGDQLAHDFVRVPGVKQARFELYASELVLVMDDRIADDAVPPLVAKWGPGVRAILGSGRGAYLPPLDYPRGVDVAVLTRTGAAVGPLETLRVPGRITIFDVYADWCVACRPMDLHVREFARTHRNVAVRKLNLARWDSPLARELGPRLTALPHVVVFSPDGRRREFDGAPWETIAKTMRW